MLRKATLFIVAGFLMMCSEVDHSHQIDDTYEIFSTAYRNLDISLMVDIYDEDAYYLSPISRPFLFFGFGPPHKRIWKDRVRRND